jgi:ribosomal protein L37AE/L43A
MEDTIKKENKINEQEYICPNCKKNQTKIIKVNICDSELNGSIWYKCSVSNTCPLFQIKNV